MPLFPFRRISHRRAEMFHVGFTDIGHSDRFNEFGDANEPRANVYRQRRKLIVHRIVERLDDPRHEQ